MKFFDIEYFQVLLNADQCSKMFLFSVNGFSVGHERLSQKFVSKLHQYTTTLFAAGAVNPLKILK